MTLILSKLWPMCTLRNSSTIVLSPTWIIYIVFLLLLQEGQWQLKWIFFVLKAKGGLKGGCSWRQSRGKETIYCAQEWDCILTSDSTLGSICCISQLNLTLFCKFLHHKCNWAKRDVRCPLIVWPGDRDIQLPSKNGFQAWEEGALSHYH